MIVTLLVSTGAPWEAAALGALAGHPGVVVLKRCVDVDDLLATASAGQAQVAVLGAELAGLDAAVVDQLGHYGVRIVAVATDDEVARAHAHRVGITAIVRSDQVGDLPGVVLREPAAPAPTVVPPSPEPQPDSGRVIAVWGPAGAPGRTTTATAVVAELARRGLPTVLVDADPYGGAVAQQLGILDEVSGLLAAARLVTGGSLDERFPSVQRQISSHLAVVTGLPRPDRWAEVRPGVLRALLERARQGAHVVVDTGFSVERDPALDQGVRPERNGLTVEALESADEILVVGSADPVGLARLARAVSDVHELLPTPTIRLVVNRMRPSLGWREADVRTMLVGFGSSVGIHFLPDDQPAVDRALVAGRSLLESGESPLTRAVADLLGAPVAGRRVRR
ncbi:hypothetical protein F0U44_09475 [Nocardioides humilatus]|uniref:Chromosome partitioning protein n=1 Tax=Nocardioides humilatus TaxID=2607660 RepID=A0A5B1LDI6_9ACTN|nr:hypothetical protein [Nocardioides humilatus]KAA1418715.1 hypothetical protein F0U44_09475 [Nocardioides humilatus]